MMNETIMSKAMEATKKDNKMFKAFKSYKEGAADKKLVSFFENLKTNDTNSYNYMDALYKGYMMGLESREEIAKKKFSGRNYPIMEKRVFCFLAETLKQYVGEGNYFIDGHIKATEEKSWAESDIHIQSGGESHVILLDGRLYHADKADDDRRHARMFADAGMTTVRVRDAGLPYMRDDKFTNLNMSRDLCTKAGTEDACVALIEYFNKTSKTLSGVKFDKTVFEKAYADYESLYESTLTGQAFVASIPEDMRKNIASLTKRLEGIHAKYYYKRNVKDEKKAAYASGKEDVKKLCLSPNVKAVMLETYKDFPQLKYFL